MKTLKYACRLLARSKSYTIINLAGLALSLACCIILMRYIHREMTVDSHALHPDNVVIPLRDVEGNVYPCAQQYMDTVYIQPTDIKEEARFITLPQSNVVLQDKPYTANLFITDSTYFRFFRYETTAGELQLSAPDDALITESFARRVYGKESPVGKTLEYANGNIATIRGVVKDPRCKTTHNFDVMLNVRLRKRWGRLSGAYIRLQPNVSVTEINQTSSVYRKTNHGTVRSLFLPVTQFYWYENSERNSDMERHGNRSHIFLLTGVCLLVLLTGVINFINLYLVLIMKRSKEFGIKKIFGIRMRTLFFQLWIENALLITGALFFAWLLIEVTAVPINRLLRSEVSYTGFDIWLSAGIWLLLPLLTCIYPYYKFNHRTPIVGIHTVSTTKQSVTARLTFLFIQCAVTFLLVILSLYFGRHLNLLLNTDPGFRQESLLFAKLQHENDYYTMSDEEQKNSSDRIQILKQKLDESPLIEQWMPIKDGLLDNGSTLKLLNDKDVALNVQVKWVSSDFFNIYGFQIIEGAIPSKADFNSYKFVMTESALKAFGYEHCNEAFIRGETPLWIWVTQDGKLHEEGLQLMPVEAVVNDFYSGHITAGKLPVVFMVNSSSGRNYQMLCVPGKEKELIAYLKKVVNEIYGTDEFEYYWMKDRVTALYDKDKQVTGIYMFFAFIAIVISCLGLFGLSLFDIRQRYREIAIRKVNGARLKDLYPLLFRKYMVVLGLAFLVAAPLAYYIIYGYTKDFVIKAPVTLSIFMIALAIVLLISAGTLLWQIRKAAHINPAKVMKTE